VFFCRSVYLCFFLGGGGDYVIIKYVRTGIHVHYQFGAVLWIRTNFFRIRFGSTIFFFDSESILDSVSDLDPIQIFDQKFFNIVALIACILSGNLFDRGKKFSK
jgi:hypothetical protein